jgi:prepilin-type N-terminal cleavage/methylation domain-containing protein
LAFILYGPVHQTAIVAGGFPFVLRKRLIGSGERWRIGLEMVSRRESKGYTLIEIMMVVMIMGILLSIAVPNYVAAERTSRAQSCVDGLQQIDTAKAQFAVENGLSTGDSVGDALALVPTFLPAWPTSVIPGTFTANPIGTAPTFNGDTAAFFTQHCLTGTSDVQCPF